MACAEAPRGSPYVSRPGSLVANRSLYAAPPRSRRYSCIPSASASRTAWASRTKPTGWLPKAQVAPGLVRRLGAGEPEAVERCDGPPVDLEEPQSQPPFPQRQLREFPMERGRLQEGRLGAAPPRAMKPEERVQIALQPIGIRGEAVRHGPELAELSREAAHLLPEVAPSLLEEFVPARHLEAQHGAGFAIERTSAVQRGEALVAGDVLREQDETPQRNRVDRPGDRSGGVRVGERRADRAELVARAVAHEAQDGHAVPPPHVHRHDGRRLTSSDGPARSAMCPPSRSDATR